METLIRLSSTLSSQIKELGVKVSTRDVKSKGSFENSIDRDSGQLISARVLSAAVAGEVLFETSGNFHDFILQIEDATIALLLANFDLHELPQVSSIFVARAAQFGNVDTLGCVYSVSQIGTIRSSIRTIASNDFDRLSDHLDALFLSISSCSEKKISIATEPLLRGLTRALSAPEVSKKQLSYLVQHDDPFTSILHLKLPPVSFSYAAIASQSVVKTKVKGTTITIRVENAGSEQVHGLYSLVPCPSITTSSSTNSKMQNPVYSSLDGYLIVRQQKEICISFKDQDIVDSIPKEECADSSPASILSTEDSAPCSGDSNSNEVSRDAEVTIYRWMISNPSLVSNYYTCCTADPSSLPPALGWRPCGALCQGKLPGPQLAVTIIEDESDKSDCDDSEGDDVGGDLKPDSAQPPKAPTEKKKRRVRKVSAESPMTITVLSASAFLPCDVSLPGDSALTFGATAKRDINDLRMRRALRGKVLRRSVIPCIEAAFPPLSDVNVAENDIATNGEVHALHNSINNYQEKHRNAFAEAIKLCDKHYSSTVSGEEHLLSLFEQFRSAEAVQKNKMTEISERMAWLAEVTNTDDLLMGLPGPKGPDMDGLLDMEAFYAKWALKKVVTRVTAPPTIVKSICSLASKTFKATVSGKSIEESSPVAIADLASEGEGRVRKVSSMSSFKASDDLQKSHRRSSSQSIFQWPVGVGAFLAHTQQIEDDRHIMQEGSNLQSVPWTDSGLRSPVGSTRQQWPPILSDTERAHTVTAESPGDLLGGLGTKGGKDEGGVNCSQSLAELLEIVSPLEQLCDTYSTVEVLGVQMRGSTVISSSSAYRGVEKACYVIRVSLRDSCCAKASVGVGAAGGAGVGGGAGAGVAGAAGSQSSSNIISSDATITSIDGGSCSVDGDETVPGLTIAVESRHTLSPESTLSRDKVSSRDLLAPQSSRASSGLPSAHSYSRRVCTVKRDLAALSLLHAQLSDLLQGHIDDDILPPPFPDPYLIATLEEGLANSTPPPLNRFSRQRLPKKEETFAYSRNMRTQNPKSKEAVECPELDHALEEIEEYLTSVIALVETIDEHAFSEDVKDADGNWRGRVVDDDSLISRLGKVLGSFLTSPDQEEKSQQHQHSMHTSLAEASEQRSTSSTFALNVLPHAAGKGFDSSPPTPGRDRVPRNKACWRPYLTSGLKMRLNLSDDQGGKLSLKSDEELLRAQGARCLGCGEHISAQWGFLGMDRNYQPCRFYGGLFCRKWCHSNDRRQIPHRLLLYWDHAAHRVSRQAARYLDAIWSQPVLLLNKANPLLYEGVPALRLARNMRGRAVQFIRRMLKGDECIDRLEMREAILGVLGADQVHLCLSKELYSISDLVGVQTGDVLASLETLIGVLREKDRSLGKG